jgi:hypothetical protein
MGDQKSVQKNIQLKAFDQGRRQFDKGRWQFDQGR